MTSAGPPPSTPVRAPSADLTRVAGAALCLAGVVAAIVWINRVSAEVKGNGGSCASGGPYVSVRPCPQTTWVMPVGIVGGLALVLVYGVLAVRGGPNWVLLAWPALFISLGVQFARFADDIQTVPYIICAVMFFAMGAGPLVLSLFTARPALWAVVVGDPTEYGSRAPGRTGPTTTLDRLAAEAAEARARTSRDADRLLDARRRVTVANAVDPAAAAGPAEVVAALNRVVKLHRQGALSAEEFAAAKRAILGLDEDGS